MAEIRPFPGVRYNMGPVGNLYEVICPPYDIITPQMQEELYRRSQYNFVRIELNRQLPQDTAEDNKYTRAAATLEQWLEQGVLKTDEVPALYLHEHRFSYQGKEYKRRGLFASVRLEPWERQVVRPHEGTLGEPKSDRINLLRACRANTSPIMTLYEDLTGQVASLLEAQAVGRPVLSAGTANGERHRVWAITDGDVVDQICCRLAELPLYIADGHHRYESALTYQRERTGVVASLSGDEAFNYVMMTLIDFADPGLLILPPHRLVRGIPRPTLDSLLGELRLFFNLGELSLDMPDVWQQVDDFLSRGTGQDRLAVYGLAGERLRLLELRDPAAVGEMMPFFHSELYKRLIVSILDHVILEKLLGVVGEREATVLAYSYEKWDAVSKVQSQQYQLAFLLSPARAEVIKGIADAGDRMPRKSTYFYPKLPTGLILRRV